jgi:hypothetical protein
MSQPKRMEKLVIDSKKRDEQVAQFSGVGFGLLCAVP